MYLGNVKINRIVKELDGKSFYYMKHKPTGKFVSGIYTDRVNFNTYRRPKGIWFERRNPSNKISSAEFQRLRNSYYPSKNGADPYNIYEQEYEDAPLNVDWDGGKQILTFNNYDDLRKTLKESISHRNSLLKKNIIFLSPADAKKLKEFNVKNLSNDEIKQIIVNMYEEKPNEVFLARHVFAVRKADKFENALFTDNPAQFLTSFFENAYVGRYDHSYDSQMAAVLPKIQEVLEIFDVCKTEINLKQDQIISEDVMLNELTLLLVNKMSESK
jgi:hypothetical protein